MGQCCTVEIKEYSSKKYVVFHSAANGIRSKGLTVDMKTEDVRFIYLHIFCMHQYQDGAHLSQMYKYLFPIVKDYSTERIKI